MTLKALNGIAAASIKTYEGVATAAVKTWNGETVAAVIVVSNVVLLHFNGSDASTTITNSVGAATFTVTGNAQLDTAQQKFGTASLLCDGTGDNVVSTDIGNVLPASGGWTIDTWVRFNAFPGTNNVFFDYRNTVAGYGIDVSYYTAGDLLKLYLSSGGSSYNIANGTSMSPGWTTGTWHHIALVRDDTAGNYYLYVDGVAGITVTSALQVRNDLDEIGVGATPNASGSTDGWIDEFRIASGCAFPSGTTFTPPTTEY